jgi:drug/metabolite transporter (DMT)-like permease
MGARGKFILSMTVFGTLGLFVRFIPLASEALALCRAVLAAGFLGGYLLLGKKTISRAALRQELVWLILSGICLGLDWTFLFQAYKYTTISIATLSYYFAPVLVMIACPLLFREKLTPKQIFCFCMSTLGLVLIVGTGTTESGQNTLLGVLCGLIAAVFYAAVILLNKKLNKTEDLPRALVQFLSAILVLGPYVLLEGNLHLDTLNSAGILCLLTVGLFHTGFTYCLYFSSLHELTGQKAAILSYIDPLIAVVISVLLLREPISIAELLGGMLILGFTLWNELPSKTKQSQLPKRERS